MVSKKSNKSKKEVKANEILPKTIEENEPQENLAEMQQMQVQEVKRELKSISNELASTTESVNNQSEYNDLKRSIYQLSNSVKTLQQTSKMMYPIAEPTNKDCGCSNNSGCNEVKQCCVQLYISRVRVIRGQKIQEPRDMVTLELIFAVRALDMCGLFPGLTSHMTIDKNSGWVPAYSPIGKFCVPCNRKLTIPLNAEARETGDISELRPEFGSATSTITLSCDCDIVPVQIPIYLNGGGNAGGEVEVEVSARKINGGCC